MLMVDTSVWVDYFNGYPSPEAEYLHDRLVANDPIVLPGIVVTEILAGLRREDEAQRIGDMLAAFDAPPELTSSDYRSASGIYRTCRTAGASIRSVVDCLIAQICIRHRFELLSKDKDFARIARHASLQIVEFD
jgi:predicted nucleic acid-binding protein